MNKIQFEIQTHLELHFLLLLLEITSIGVLVENRLINSLKFVFNRVPFKITRTRVCLLEIRTQNQFDCFLFCKTQRTALLNMFPAIFELNFIF